MTQQYKIALIGEECYNRDPLFWDNTVMDGECLIPTTKHGTANGYKLVKRGGKSVLAHRYAFTLFYTKEPIDLVCHSCDRRSCCLPIHLFEGNATMNQLDALAKGRNFSQKLSIEEAKEIRREYAAGNVTMESLAKKYGVGLTSVRKIIRRFSYVYV